MLSHTARRLLLGLILTCGALVSLGTGSALAAFTAQTGAATNVTSSSAVVQGTLTATSSDTAYAFEYGTTTAYGKFTTITPAKQGTQNVSATITGLAANTTYHVQLLGTDGATDPATPAFGGDVTFTTTGTSSAATTGSATGITATSATLTGTADPNNAGEYAFQYGTSTTYSSQTQAFSVASGVHQVSAGITGLTPGTTYHYQLVVVAQSPLGAAYNTYAAGGDQTFTTKASNGKPNPGPKKKKKFGTLGLNTGKLKLNGASVTLPLHCSGPSTAKCAGILNITTKVGKDKLKCASKRFTTKAHGDFKLTMKLSAACVAIVTTSTSQTLQATLTGKFSTKQKPYSHKLSLRLAAT